MAGLWSAYSRVLMAHPFKTQVATTGAIMFCSDTFAQQVVEKRGWKAHDFKRTCRQGLLGIVLVGPALSIWYRALDGFFKGAPQIALIKKVVADQACFAPPFIATFFIMNGLLERIPPQTIKARISKNYMQTLFTNYKVWPAVQVINFYVIPLYYRVLFANIISVFWNTYLIWKANDDVTDVTVTNGTDHVTEIKGTDQGTEIKETDEDKGV